MTDKEMTGVESENSPQTYGGRELTPVLENYLEIIFRLETDEGAARAGSIADAAGVSRSTVTSTMKVLKAMDLIEYSPYSLIYLTERGRAIGRDVAHRHFIFQEFLGSILQIDPQDADEIACKLEHVVPAEATKRLGQFVLYLKTRKKLWEKWREEYEKEGIAKMPHAASVKQQFPRSQGQPGHDVSHNPYR